MKMSEDLYRVKGMPEDEKDDHIVRAVALGGHVKAVAIRSKAIVSEAQKIHNTSSVVTAALGRFLTGSLLIAENMKNEDDTQTTVIRADGPIGGMTCVCDSKGHVRGYPLENDVPSTYHKPGKLNVGAAVGKGTLTVIRDLGLREPFTGMVELMSGEIAEDFTYYLASSEQTPSVVALGVSMDNSGVLEAGGMMIQLMPGATEEDIDYIEKRANGGFPDITFLMEEGFSPAKILDLFLGDPAIEFTDAYPVSYHCPCSKERMSEGIAALGKAELEKLSEDPDGIETQCHFCNRKYRFGRDEIKALLNN